LYISVALSCMLYVFHFLKSY